MISPISPISVPHLNNAVQEIKEAGTSLVQLKAAGTPMATLKDSNYTAERLKQQGYTAAELAFGARGRVQIPNVRPPPLEPVTVSSFLLVRCPSNP